MSIHKNPLHIAALFETEKEVKLLLENGADINAKDDNGDTPLHLAANYNTVEVVKLLLKKGSSVNSENKFRETPIFKVMDIEIVKLLIEKGADVNHTANTIDVAKVTPLYYAVRYRKIEIIKVLLENGADIYGNTLDGMYYLRPISLAITYGDNEIVDLLLSY